MAVTKVFPLPSLPRKQPTVLVVCGPDQNGAIGLVCARHLRVFRLHGQYAAGFRRGSCCDRRMTLLLGVRWLSGPFPAWTEGCTAQLSPCQMSQQRGIRADHLLPQAVPEFPVSGFHHPVRKDGHPLPLVPADGGPADQRRLQRGDRRHPGSRRRAGGGEGALHQHLSHPETDPDPHRQPGRALRVGRGDGKQRGNQP
ncbi:yjeF N-terminal domain-containing protein 3 isoform X3 [Chrysemys picta bellii]